MSTTPRLAPSPTPRRSPLATLRALALAACLPALALGACADTDATVPDEEPGLTVGKADGHAADNWTYFRAVRHDQRRCMYPLCGGVYVSRVNQPRTKCGDGVWAKDCYVAAFDFTEIGVRGEAAIALSQLTRDGHVVVRGAIETGHFPEFPDVAVFSVTEAWRAAGDRAPKGKLYRAHDEGIVCITWPCVSIELTRLNRNLDPVTRVAGADLSRTGATDAQIEDAWQRMLDDAVVIAGALKDTTGPGGTAKTIVASQFYTRVVGTDAVGQPCGSRGHEPCAPGLYCQFNDEMCGALDGGGTCQAIPDFCTMEYAPVCGCDGMTYSNDCFRRAAGVGFGTAGECEAAEAACQTGGCSGQLCVSADAEPPITTCEWRPEYECYQLHGVCEDSGDGCGWTMSPELEACLREAAGNR